MTTTSTPLGGAPALRFQWLDRLAFAPWEWVFYGTILLLAIATRFWDLGGRALHHDESLHAVYSWYLYTGTGYQHDPLMHGPFQFHGGALMYFLFGDSDASARFLAAFMGVGICLLPILLRPAIGLLPAALSSLLLLISPVFLYYGRFAREDIYVATFTLAMAIAAWRYLVSGEYRWLVGLAAALALAFATKESTFITVAVFGSFFTFRMIAEAIDRRHQGLSFRNAIQTRDFDIAMVLGIFTLPQLMPFLGLLFPFAGIERTIAGTFPVAGVVRNDQLAAVVVTVVAVAVAIGIGLLWNRQQFWKVFLAFTIPWVLLYTTFFSNPGGIGTGIWGSLDYWLVQQGVQRGEQPGYYYFLLLPIYEFLPLAVAAVGGFLVALRRGPVWLLLVPAFLGAWYGLSLLPETVTKFGTVGLIFLVTLVVLVFARQRGWGMFLAYWFVAGLAAYSIAGEKMPWLSLHMALPVILGAGLVLGTWIRTVPWVRFWQSRSWLLAAAVPLVALVAALVLRARINQPPGNELGTILTIAGVGLILLGGAAWLASRDDRWMPGPAIVVGLLVIGGALTLRTGFVAAFQNGDVPVEMLVYTQTTPDIPRLADEIRVLQNTRAPGTPLRIWVDSEEGYTWPWAWYLRGIPGVQYPTLRGSTTPPDADVLLVHMVNDGQVRPLAGEFGPGTRYRHRWWFPEDYRNLTLERFAQNLANPESYRIWWDYFLHRRTVSPLGSTDGVIYFPQTFRSPVSS